MTKTHEDYKKLLAECKDGCIKDEAKFAKLLNMLMVEVLIDLREVLRDIRTQLKIDQ